MQKMKIEPEHVKHESNTADVVLSCEEGAERFQIDGNQTICDSDSSAVEMADRFNNTEVSDLPERVSANEAIHVAAEDGVKNVLSNESHEIKSQNDDPANAIDSTSVHPIGDVRQNAESSSEPLTKGILPEHVTNDAKENVPVSQTRDNASVENHISNGECVQSLSLDDMLAAMDTIGNPNFMEFSAAASSSNVSNKSSAPVEMSLRKVISSGVCETEENLKNNKPRAIEDSEDDLLDCAPGSESINTNSGSNDRTKNEAFDSSGATNAVNQSGGTGSSDALVQPPQGTILDGPDPAFATELASRSSAKKSRRVTFPNDDKMVYGYLNPQIPWKDAWLCSMEDLLMAYRNTCSRLAVKPIKTLVSQLQGITIFDERNETLTLKGEPLDIRHSDALEEILRRVQFQTIDLESTRLDDETSVILFDMIEFYESCLKLNISNNSNIGVRGWQACARMLKRSASMVHLEARGCNIPDQAMPFIGRSLQTGCSLHTLQLENSIRSGRHLMMLVSAVKMNGSLKELYLGNNQLMPTDGTHIGGLLRYSRSITLLDVRNNHLQDVGLARVCDSLCERQSSQDTSVLTTLILWNNQLTYESMSALAKVLAVSPTLETLNVGHNNLTNEGVYRLKDSLLQNRSLLRFGLQSTKLSCEGAVALAEFIAESRRLIRLDLRSNAIKTAGLMALTLSLKVNRTVTAVDLDQETKKDSSIKDYANQQKRLLGDISSYIERNCLVQQHLQATAAAAAAEAALIAASGDAASTGTPGDAANTAASGEAVAENLVVSNDLTVGAENKIENLETGSLSSVKSSTTQLSLPLSHAVRAQTLESPGYASGNQESSGLNILEFSSILPVNVVTGEIPSSYKFSGFLPGALESGDGNSSALAYGTEAVESPTFSLEDSGEAGPFANRILTSPTFVPSDRSSFDARIISESMNKSILGNENSLVFPRLEESVKMEASLSDDSCLKLLPIPSTQPIVLFPPTPISLVSPLETSQYGGEISPRWDAEENRTRFEVIPVIENDLGSIAESVGSLVKPVGSIVEPVGSLVEPDSSIVEPVSPLVEPVGSVVEPVGPLVESVSSIVEPVGSLVEPVSSIVEPVSSLAEPVSSIVEPVSSLVEPVSSIVEPVSSLAEPVSSIVEPVGSLVEPVSSIVEPVSSLVEPVGSIVEPVSPPIEPVGSNVEPVDSIVEPDISNFDASHINTLSYPDVTSSEHSHSAVGVIVDENASNLPTAGHLDTSEVTTWSDPSRTDDAIIASNAYESNSTTEILRDALTDPVQIQTASTESRSELEIHNFPDVIRPNVEEVFVPLVPPEELDDPLVAVMEKLEDPGGILVRHDEENVEMREGMITLQEDERVVGASQGTEVGTAGASVESPAVLYEHYERQKNAAAKTTQKVLSVSGEDVNEEIKETNVGESECEGDRNVKSRRAKE